MRPRALRPLSVLVLLLLLLLLGSASAAGRNPKCRRDANVTTLAREAPVVIEALVVNLNRQFAGLQVNKTFRGHLDVKKLQRPLRDSGSSAALVLRLDSCSRNFAEPLRMGSRYLVFARATKRSLIPLGPPVLVSKEVIRIVHSIVRKGRGSKLPTITGPTTTTVEEKTPLKLQCNITGKALASVQWVKDGKRLHPDKRVKIKSKRRETRLNVKSVTVEDQGAYTCQGRLFEGTLIAHTINVYVTRKEPPSYVYKPCGSTMDNNGFCMNGGKCFIPPMLSIMYCECAEGYDGPRCETKAVSDMTNIHGDLTTRELSTYWGK